MLGVVGQKQGQRPNIYFIISQSHYTLQQEQGNSTRKLHIAGYWRLILVILVSWGADGGSG
jgi:hypothetical protein